MSYENFDVLLVDNSDDDYVKTIKKIGLNAVKGPKEEDVIKRISESRNVLRKKVIEGDYDYFLSLEQDIVPPKDVIEKLLKADKDIVSGLYMNFFVNNFGEGEMRPLAYAATSKAQFEILKKDPKYEGTEIRRKIKEGIIKKPEDIYAQLSAAEVQGNKLMEVLFTGLGCMLIKKEVLEKIKFRHPKDSFDDYAFCMDARKKGYKIWLDTSVKCTHVSDMKTKRE